MAIALPTFMGAFERVRDAAAKASLRTALTAGRVYFVSGSGDYAGVELIDLTKVEDSILWRDGSVNSEQPKEVSRAVEGGVLTLASYSKGGTCFFVRDDPPNDLTYGRLDTTTDCRADKILAVTMGKQLVN